MVVGSESKGFGVEGDGLIKLARSKGLVTRVLLEVRLRLHLRFLLLLRKIYG